MQIMKILSVVQMQQVFFNKLGPLRGKIHNLQVPRKQSVFSPIRLE
jgi:hypothetical protein